MSITGQISAVADWLRSNGFVRDEQRSCWGVAWSGRSGYDFTNLEFVQIGQSHSWYAIVGHHASGENPRMNIGTCDTLEDVQRTYEAIRLINGYPGP